MGDVINMDNYTQKVIWVGTVLGDASTDEFEKFFLDLGFRVKHDWEFVMSGGFYEGFHCMIFNLHNDDVSEFSLFRLTTNDMKWLEDFVDNNGYDSFSDEFHERYSEYLNC